MEAALPVDVKGIEDCPGYFTGTSANRWALYEVNKETGEVASGD